MVFAKLRLTPLVLGLGQSVNAPRFFGVWMKKPTWYDWCANVGNTKTTPSTLVQGSWGSV